MGFFFITLIPCGPSALYLSFLYMCVYSAIKLKFLPSCLLSNHNAISASPAWDYCLICAWCNNYWFVAGGILHSYVRPQIYPSTVAVLKHHQSSCVAVVMTFKSIESTTVECGTFVSVCCIVCLANYMFVWPTASTFVRKFALTNNISSGNLPIQHTATGNGQEPHNGENLHK